MNTHTFDNHSVTCPICQRTGYLKPVKMYTGLFTCPYCQERLVVCKAGHYVRDPYSYRQIGISSLLRRQSHPIARIVRDFGIFKRPAVILALGSAIMFGATTVALQNLQQGQQDTGNFMEKVTDIINPPPEGK